MKVRKEISGLHFFDRNSGLHILYDERKFSDSEICNSPRTLSIALTNVCDLKCPFCYAPKSKHSLEINYLKEVIIEAERLGVLELTFGGGEPILYPFLPEIINWTYENTLMSINFTTHGHYLQSDFVNKIGDKISKIRISIDGLEPRYSSIRKKELKSLEILIRNNIVGKIRFGVNTVFTKDYIDSLPSVIEYAKSLGAEDILLIPEHRNGKIDFDNSDYNKLTKLISEYKDYFQIYLTSNIDDDIDIPTLDICDEKEFLFAHLSADKILKRNSYIKEGIQLDDPKNLSTLFRFLNN